jgi:nucleotide-binding universal stress UspA family protein
MRVLLAVDRSKYSQAALCTLIEQVRPERAQVRVLHMVEWNEGLEPAFYFAEGPHAARDLLAAHERADTTAENLVAAATTRLRDAGFKAEPIVQDGDAAAGILQMAEEWHADLVVMGSHGRHGLQRLLLGSVSDVVVRRANCAVLVVRGQQMLPADPADCGCDFTAVSPAAKT